MMPALDNFDLQKRLDDSPFNRWLGLTVLGIAPDRLDLKVDMRPEMMGSPSTRAVHGGILASIVDVTGSMAVIAHTGQTIATIDLRTDYHRPALDSVLFASGTVLNMGKRLATSEVRIHDGKGNLIASGRVVAMHVSLSEPAPSSPNP